MSQTYMKNEHVLGNPYRSASPSEVLEARTSLEDTIQRTPIEGGNMLFHQIIMNRGKALISRMESLQQDVTNFIHTGFVRGSERFSPLRALAFGGTTAAKMFLQLEAVVISYNLADNLFHFGNPTSGDFIYVAGGISILTGIFAGTCYRGIKAGQRIQREYQHGYAGVEIATSLRFSQ